MRAARILLRHNITPDLMAAIRFLQENRRCRPREIIDLDRVLRGRSLGHGELYTYSHLDYDQKGRVISALGKFSKITLQDAISAIRTHALEMDSDHNLRRKNGHEADEWFANKAPSF